MKEMRFFKNHLSPQKMKEFDDFLTRPGGMFHGEHESRFRLVYPDDAIWNLKASAHFLPRYHPSLRVCYERHLNDMSVIIVNFQGEAPETKLIVAAPDQEIIDSILATMEKYLAQSRVPKYSRSCQRPRQRIRRFSHFSSLLNNNH